MSEQSKTREIIERTAKMLELKPTRGQLTGVTHARLISGSRCEIKDGPWTLAADMPSKAGGTDTAPSPMVLSRAALASCLVIGITRWAARMEIPIDALEVEVQGDFDARGELGVGENIPAGFQEVRYSISIASPATEDRIAELVQATESNSPLLDIFKRPLQVRRSLRHNGSEIKD